MHYQNTLMMNNPVAKQFTLESEIKYVKQLRKDIDKLIQDTRLLNISSPSREVSLCLTKLEEAKMWLGKRLGELGQANPYPESTNPESLSIEPETDKYDQ